MADDKFAKAKIKQTRAPLQASEKDVMFATLIRKRAAFDAAAMMLTWEQIAEYDRPYGVLWDVVKTYYEQHQKLPSWTLAQTGVGRVMATDPDILSETGKQSLHQFMQYAYHVKLSELSVDAALQFLQQYLEDRVVDTVRDTLSGYTPINVSEVLQDAAVQAAQFNGVGASGLDDPFPTDWDAEGDPLELRDTGVSFFNHYLGKGRRALEESFEGEVMEDDTLQTFGHGCGESIALLGPYGSGKTTTATMLTVQAAQLALNQWNLSKRKSQLRVVYHVTWEEPQHSLRLRALSYLAQIPGDYLKQALRKAAKGHGRLTDHLSTTGKLRAYEKRRWANNLQLGAPVPGERERAKRATDILNRTWRVIDLTAANAQGFNGAGLLDEVRTIIQQDQRVLAQKYAKGVGVELIVLDYVAAAAERYFDSTGLSRDGNLRHVINRWPMHAKNKLALPFSCPVWSMHQLSTAANAMKPGAVPKITDSAEGRAFGENLDVCFMFGVPDGDARMVLVCQKVRREKKLPTMVVRLDGEHARVVDDSKHFTLRGGQIVSRQESDTLTDIFGEGAAVAPKLAGAGGDTPGGMPKFKIEYQEDELDDVTQIAKHNQTKPLPVPGQKSGKRTRQRRTQTMR